MGRRTMKFTIFSWTGDGIQVYLMCDRSGQQTVYVTVNYLVVAKVRKRLTVTKEATHRVNMETFNLRNEMK
jgi:hypothetical protein